MMSRIGPMFDALKEEGRAGFIPYITMGDPSLARSEEILEALVDSGADLIELGVPFTDPMADGPTLQAAAQRALKNPIRIENILEAVSRFRAKYQTPVILFGYANPFLAYGWEKLATDGASAGIDGFLCVDMPPDEGAPLRDAARRRNLDVIYLLAPTSTAERRRYVASHASGFLYYVSVTGVTGARETLRQDVRIHVEEIRRESSLPVAVGFGISNPNHVREIASVADAVVVGSAIVKVIERVGDTPELAGRVAEFSRSLRSGIGK